MRGKCRTLSRLGLDKLSVIYLIYICMVASIQTGCDAALTMKGTRRTRGSLLLIGTSFPPSSKITERIVLGQDRKIALQL